MIQANNDRKSGITINYFCGDLTAVFHKVDPSGFGTFQNSFPINKKRKTSQIIDKPCDIKDKGTSDTQISE